MSEVNESFQTKTRKRFVGKAAAKKKKEETQQVENTESKSIIGSITAIGNILLIILTFYYSN
jgi:hypothetical protein